MVRHKIIPAVYIIFKNNIGETLFLRRANTSYQDGKLSLVASHVEENEDFKIAAVRESKEEVGVDILEENLNFSHIQIRNASDGERIDVFFEVTKWEGEIKNCEPEKCSELIWSIKEEKKDELIPQLFDILESVENKKVYSRYNY